MKFESCEICHQEATHVDSAMPDPAKSSGHHDFQYRQQYLCLAHASERRTVNTARVMCLHVRLDCDGICHTCGADCRGGGA